MKCTDCCYYWKAEDDNYPYCHWENKCAGDISPCELEDFDTEI